MCYFKYFLYCKLAIFKLLSFITRKYKRHQVKKAASKNYKGRENTKINSSWYRQTIIGLTALHSLLTKTVNAGKWLTSCPSCFQLPRGPTTHWIEGFLRLRSHLDVFGKRNVCSPFLDIITHLCTSQPSCYTNQSERYVPKFETKFLPLSTVTNFLYHGTFVSKRAFGKHISVNSLSGIA